MKYSIFCALLLCWSIANGQTTTYEIDYSYDVSLGTSCNVFSSEKTLSGFKHQATKGFPKYTVDTHNGSHINLACKRNSSSSQLGTDYQILFPFKKDYKYQINVLYKGSYASGEFVPIIGLKMNVTKKTHNTSVSCTGAQSIDIGQYQGQGVSGSGFAWPSSPLITTGALTQDYESLSIAALTTQSPLTTQTQEIQVRTVRIVEIAPTPTVANDEYTGAISLTPDASTPVSGTTSNATPSSQARPKGYNPPHYIMTKDVWYKFVATSTTHTLSITNENFYGSDFGIPFIATALYNSSLSVLKYSGNNTVTFNSLTIGQTYFVRLWAGSGHSEKTISFDLSLVSDGPSNITGISRTGYTFTVTYEHSSSIPASDITFEWAVYPGEIEPATNYSVEQGLGPHQIYVVPGEGEGDTTVRVKVRMKRISTNEPLTDWYAYSPLVWFG